MPLFLSSSGGRVGTSINDTSYLLVMIARIQTANNVPYTLQRKSHVFLFLELCGLSHNFHIHVFVSDLYISSICPHIFCSRTARSIVGIYKSHTQTRECGNWDCGRAIPFLRIFVSNFQYWFFAVCGKSCNIIKV
jgi:hypothetical protein